jgi:Flp pilus assembly protein TadD/dienelactone hydrolase
MRRIPLLGLLLILASLGLAQTPPRQVRPEHDLNSYGVVEQVPGMEKIVVREVTWKTVTGTALQMDVYAPPGAPKGALPAVVFVNGVGMWPGGTPLRTWGQYTSWPRLIAASGMVAVTFDARGEQANAEDVRDLLAYVRDHAKDLGIDASRVAAWACSANVRSTLAVLMAPEAPPVVAAVLYYGAGDVTAFRGDLPVLLVRAGRDRPQMNEMLDRLAAQAVSANAPWTVMNVPAGHHAFDVLDDTEESRVAIRGTVAYLRDRLFPAPPSTRPKSEALEALSHFLPGEWAEAEASYGRYVEKHPGDSEAWTLLGNAQVELKKPEAAAVSLKKAIAIDPSIGEAWAMLGRIEADKKNYGEAITLLNKAIALMPTDAEAHFQLGKIQLAQNDAAGAVASLERAVELSPGNGWAWNSLAYAYLAAKRPDKAAASFERVLPFAPKNLTLLYNAACAYSLAGNKDKAIELLDRAVTEGYKDKAGMTADPDLGSVRDDPRFAEILKKLG